MNRCIRTALVAALALCLSSCVTADPAPVAISDRDAAALATLAEVAGPTSDVDPSAITRTECWLPSDHLVDDATVSDTTWRVLCRAHYVDESGDRYQDATCVGDFAVEPMLDHCYRWAFYAGEPLFEDFPAVVAG
jgi:hypothetical protein